MTKAIITFKGVPSSGFRNAWFRELKSNRKDLTKFIKLAKYLWRFAQYSIYILWRSLSSSFWKEVSSVVVEFFRKRNHLPRQNHLYIVGKKVSIYFGTDGCLCKDVFPNYMYFIIKLSEIYFNGLCKIRRSLFLRIHDFVCSKQWLRIRLSTTSDDMAASLKLAHARSVSDRWYVQHG